MKEIKHLAYRKPANAASSENGKAIMKIKIAKMIRMFQFPV